MEEEDTYSDDDDLSGEDYNGSFGEYDGFDTGEEENYSDDQEYTLEEEEKEEEEKEEIIYIPINK